jgi:hypothetical protein
VYVMPPYVLEADDITWLAQRVTMVLEQVLGQMFEQTLEQGASMVAETSNHASDASSKSQVHLGSLP